MNGSTAPWLFALAVVLMVVGVFAVWCCLFVAGRDDVELVAHEADRPWDAGR